MKYKNELERRAFEIAQRVLGQRVTLEHNKRLTIESGLFSEVASFKGPPAKEIDVLAAEVRTDPRVSLLVSCKELDRRASPGQVQEWAAVVQAMNRYSAGTRFLGLVVSPSGFSDGCEAWASSHNLGLVPPLKGRRLLFSSDTVMRMFERVVRATRTRVLLRFNDLETAPSLFDFVYRMVEDFEGHQEAGADGRFFTLPRGWLSSFSEMYAAVAGRRIQNLVAVAGASFIQLEGNTVLRFDGTRIDFGNAEVSGTSLNEVICRKNLLMEPCTLQFVKEAVAGKPITSAADFGDYVEFGVDGCLNLGVHVGGFHLVSTENPVSEHQL
ncbi:MAG: hypothetical protein WCG85_19850 [Polyangia bacterium]